jgi:hypothetical protein
VGVGFPAQRRPWLPRRSRSLRSAVLCHVASASLLASCGPALAPPAAGLPAAGHAAGVPAAELGGWMLATEEVSVRDAQLTPEGRLFILRGTRWVDHPDGSLSRARQVFEQEDVKGVSLPQHLGGGYIFYATTGPGTDLWRAPSWTGELAPLGRVEPPVSQIIPGFDRLYLGSATSYTLRAIDPESGQAQDLAPLPRAAAYGEMAFLDAWTAVVLAGVRGALASFDAGESWTPLGAPDAVTSVSLRPPNKLLIGTEAQRYELDASGQLVATSLSGSDVLFEGAQTLGRYAPDVFPGPTRAASSAHPLGRRPLRAAVLRGMPDTPETAVVLEAGALGRVRLSDGALLSSQPYQGSLPCRGVALGRGIGFVCGPPDGPTEVHAYVAQRLQPVLRLDGAHRVRSSGNGALIIDAPCALLRRPEQAREVPAGARQREQRQGQYCVRPALGEPFDVHVRGDVGSERIIALRDGRAVVLVPPRPGNAGRLTLVTPSGESSEQELTLEPEDGPAARLARSGSWLDELWETEPGQLGAWIVGAQAFVGAHIDLEGLVQLGRVQDGVDETSFFGGHALQLAASASLRESTDYGFDWRVSEVPPALVAAGLARSSPRPARGCSPVGCVHDDWLRVGYGQGEEASEPARPEAPAKVAFPSSGFTFWNLSCRATGMFARGNLEGAPKKPPVAGPERAGRSALARPRAGAEPPESSAWIQFQGLPPPARGPSDLGYDFGETNENGAYRAYAWGPGRVDWARPARWQVRVGDRFSLAPPWSTLPSRVPWADAASAAQAFGLDNSLGVDWWLRLGDSEEAGLLQLRVRSESTLHLIARERGTSTLQLPSSSDLGTPAGVQEVNDRWYIGGSRAEQFQLFRVEQGKLQLLATYPLWGRIPTQLIRSVQGDELGLLQKSTGAGWMVLPIDLETYQPKPGFHVANELLGKVPPRCDAGRPGWLAVSGVPLTDSSVSESNTHLEFAGSATGLRTKRLTARVVMDESGVCVDALAALVDGAAGTDPRSNDAGTSRSGLPLVVTDPADDRRWGFLCTQ